jgi:hypothetical protein
MINDYVETYDELLGALIEEFRVHIASINNYILLSL